MVDKEKLRLEWKQRVQEFKNSDMSMKKWCELNGFKVHQLQYWNKKFENISEDIESKATNWVAVSLNDTETQKVYDQLNNDSKLNIKIREYSIEVKTGFDSTLLIDVIKVLKTL